MFINFYNQHAILEVLDINMEIHIVKQKHKNLAQYAQQIQNI